MRRPRLVLFLLICILSVGCSKDEIYYEGKSTSQWVKMLKDKDPEARRSAVAALGNIATHPDHRRRGLGRVTTAALCRSLCAGADHIGLNVKADNTVAADLYANLGFTYACAYEEFMVRAA